jgi:sulfatase modifying factor 1
MMTIQRMRALMMGGTVAFGAAAFALAQNIPNYDFRWATVGNVNNVGYNGPTPFGLDILLGRGSVSYSYRISKLEVTTSQWMEFVNDYSTRGSDWTLFARPIMWGATDDPSYHGPGSRYVLRTDVPNAGMLPVGGITWRDAAKFCNWLNNNKAPTLDAIANGAYDISTFGRNPDGTYTDQAAHNPDANFWIPTLDEWMKAARFDPDHDGPGAGGWWEYPYMSDSPPIPGLPEDGGTTSGGYSDPMMNFGEWDIPLGAYTDYTTAYGLWDTSGGAAEWIEDYFDFDGRDRTSRFYAGSSAGGPYLVEDHSSSIMSVSPDSFGEFNGLRLASRVPSPCGGGAFVWGLWTVAHRRKRGVS